MIGPAFCFAAVAFLGACDPRDDTNPRFVETGTGEADTDIQDLKAEIEAMKSQMEALKTESENQKQGLAIVRSLARSLAQRLTDEEAKVFDLRWRVAELESSRDEMGADLDEHGELISIATDFVDGSRDTVTAAEELLTYVRVEDADVIVEGSNFHVRSGAGRTDATPNGLGNIVIGYNEPLATCQGGYNHGDVCVRTVSDCDGGSCSRVAPPITTGSHNLIIGPRHDYSSHSCLIAGDGGDGTEGPYCAVLPAH